MFNCAKIAKDICQESVQLYTYTVPPGTTCISSSAYATNGASCTCSYAGGTNTITCTTPQIDNTTTVIDGGNIITGTVTANKLNAADINASKILTVGSIEFGNHYAGNKAHEPSCKCSYCGCTNDHIYGTCDYCGAPLEGQ